LVAKNRKHANNEQYIAIFLEELSEIMRVYKENCGKVEEMYNPKSEKIKNI